MEASELGLSVRILLACVLLASGLGKAKTMPAFAGTLRALNVPRRCSAPLAWFVIAAESTLAVMLALGWEREWTAIATLLLTSIFLSVSLYARVSGRAIICNCFGTGRALLGIRTGFRSVLLLGCAFAYFWLPPMPSGSPIQDGLGTVVSVGLLATLSMILGRWVLSMPTVIASASHRRRYFTGLEDARLARHLGPS